MFVLFLFLLLLVKGLFWKKRAGLVDCCCLCIRTNGHGSCCTLLRYADARRNNERHRPSVAACTDDVSGANTEEPATTWYARRCRL